MSYISEGFKRRTDSSSGGGALKKSKSGPSYPGTGTTQLWMQILLGILVLKMLLYLGRSITKEDVNWYLEKILFRKKVLYNTDWPGFLY